MALAILSFTINKRRKASEIASPTLTEDWTSYGTLIQSPLLPWVGEMVLYFSIMGGCGAVEEATPQRQECHPVFSTSLSVCVSVCLWPPLGVCVSFCISVSVSGRVSIYVGRLGVLSVTGAGGGVGKGRQFQASALPSGTSGCWYMCTAHI